jgi:hypothetical protein
MTTANLSFAKIVANPTPLGWSQVYSAGKLFAALSLEKSEESEQKDYLNALGKELLDTLEQEFFTLETKDQETIRSAVLTTVGKIPEEVKVSFVTGAVAGNVLYLYIYGNGKVDIKREQTLGTLLEAKEEGQRQLKEASGFLQEGDIVALETQAFSEEISEETLLEFLNKPTIDEASENIAPLVHEKGNPLISSILVHYKEVEEQKEEEAIVAPVTEDSVREDGQEEEKESEDEEEKERPAEDPLHTPPSSVFPNLRRPGFNRSFKLGFLKNTKALIILLIVVVVVVFAASVLFAYQKQENDKLIAAFNSVYPAAEKKYNEGESLVDLNSSLARDSFLEAENILSGAQEQFPQNSPQQKQIAELLAKVRAALEDTAKASEKEAVEVDEDESFYLSTVKNTKATAYAKDDRNVYYLTGNAIVSIPNGSKSEKELVENDDNWSSIGGLAVYNTSLYVLEKAEDQVLKFLNTGASYQQSGYLASSAEEDFSKAVALTIDNNVYVLFSDGTVKKYFRGQEESFSLKGLDKPLKNPTKIYSLPDFENIYVLDKGNGRIVVFDKTGAFKAQYLAGVVSNAVDFEVLEEDKIIYLLSSGKIYRIDL